MKLKVVLKCFCLSFLFLFSSLCAAKSKEYSEEDYAEYEEYTAVLPIYEEPLLMPKRPKGSQESGLKWEPSNNVRGLNVLGLVPSVNVGVGHAQFDKISQSAAVYEYIWGYRVFSFFNLAFAYQNQRMETKNFTEISWKFGKKQFKNNAKLAMHSLMFKGYLESPVVLKIDHFFITPFVAGGVGPSWAQKGIFGVTVNAYEADVGLRFGATHPAAFLSLMAGCKYVIWDQLGHSFAQYLGLRLNF